MGDVVTCTAVLRKDNTGKADNLYLATPPDWKLRILSCRPKGTPPRGERPEWVYEEKDGRLHLTPSLLCLDSTFHTDYNWNCAYMLAPEATSGYDHFYTVNPDIKDE